jgi:hypothetical protein
MYSLHTSQNKYALTMTSRIPYFEPQPKPSSGSLLECYLLTTEASSFSSSYFTNMIMLPINHQDAPKAFSIFRIIGRLLLQWIQHLQNLSSTASKGLSLRTIRSIL